MEREANHASPLRQSPLRETITALLLGLLAVSPLYAMDWLTERRQQVEQMTPAEKLELNEKYNAFLNLPAEEQEQLRVLHQKLDTDPQGDRLRGVMHRYYDWLKSLTPGERADLLSLPTADRLAKIKSLKQHQEAWAARLSGGSHLTISDVQALSDWVKKYAAAHEADLLKDAPPPRHGEFPAADKAPHEHTGQFSPWRPWMGAKLPEVSQEEVDQLTQKLSAEPRKAILSQPNLHAKAEIIHQWLQAISRQRFAGGGFGHQGRNVSSKELARFFDHDLSKEKQDELSRITDKEAQHRELRRLYFQHRRATEPPTGAGADSDPHAAQTAPKTSPSPAPREKQPEPAKN